MSARAALAPAERRFLALSAMLFALAVALLAYSWQALAPRPVGVIEGLGFLAFSLFAIFCGFRHPDFGYVSFDRVAQFGALLMLDPANAAAVNMLASFLYPWQRLRQGEPVSLVLASALGNAAMMGLVILVGGLVYLGLAGELPLRALDNRTLLPLLGMAVVAHVLNDLLMALLQYARGQRARRGIDNFAFSIEMLSFVVAALFAVIWARGTLLEATLFTAVLCLGMWQLRHLGLLRLQLESLVDQRTRDLRRKSDQLEQLTLTDELTGLRNRRFAELRLEEEVEGARRRGEGLCVALGDLDHFKAINDEHSHAAGDEALRRVATSFHSHTRREDVVARYGGEEFIFLFPGLALDDAATTCERLRAAIEALNLRDVDSRLSLSVSFGVAEWQGEAATDLLRRADRALYAAKNAGRNRVERAAPGSAAPLDTLGGAGLAP